VSLLLLMSPWRMGWLPALRAAVPGGCYGAIAVRNTFSGKYFSDVTSL
jgi:hypothetical protein